MILNASELTIYPDLNLDIDSETYYTFVYYGVSVLNIIMSGWGISASFAAARSNGVVRGYISYLFALVHFAILIVVFGCLYLAFTDLEGLKRMGGRAFS